MTAHGEKAIQPLPHANVGYLTVDDLGNSPDRDFAPRILNGRVKLPITEQVSRGGIGHVIRRERELINDHHNLPVARLRYLGADRFSATIIAAIDPNLSCCHLDSRFLLKAVRHYSPA